MKWFKKHVDTVIILTSFKSILCLSAGIFCLGVSYQSQLLMNMSCGILFGIFLAEVYDNDN